jgi:hypothetical protein
MPSLVPEDCRLFIGDLHRILGNVAEGNVEELLAYQFKILIGLLATRKGTLEAGEDLIVGQRRQVAGERV